MNLQEKILEHFEGKVVRKDLTSRVKGNAVVPTYVLEYLLGQYCAIDDEAIITAGIEKVKNVISNNYVHRSDAEIVKATIRQNGSHKVIDKINVSLNDKANIYEAEFANLGIKGVPISDNMVMSNQKLLSGGGVWCIIDMGYSHAADAKVRWLIMDLKPIQVSNIRLEEYLEARASFDTEEWLDLLMHSIGLNPEFFSKRDKFIQISRLITHVENNFNFIELGPKGTGKSHIFSELSPHGVLVSGGDVSKARLFVNNTGNKIGLVGYWDVVALDEFEQDKGSKRTDGDLVKIMQNYMANKSFNRGKETYQATASMAFVGNTKHTVPYMLKNSHLFESIPMGYIKGAFLDRLHLYIPGWEVRILKSSVFSTEYGFIVDYLAEILRELRKSDYSGVIENYVELDGSLTTRDKTAIRKTFSGLAKIVYPDKKMTETEILELLDFAIEGRKRVKDQMYLVDETFRNEPVDFAYTIHSTGKKVAPETLEKLNYETAVANKKEETERKEAAIQTTVAEKPKLESGKNVVIQENQKGVSYERLFADYLRGATEIHIVDPYIRKFYQVKNFSEFCQMLYKIKPVEAELTVKLFTSPESGERQDVDSWLIQLESNLEGSGINLEYTLEDPGSLHDRYIETDHGWKITLGRGLDIFHAFDFRDVFNLANGIQEERNCRGFEVGYFKDVG
jgi:ATP-dependent Lon protease